MFVAALILIVSLGLLCFYFEIVCRKILRRRAEEEYFHAIVDANRLEFVSVRKSIEDLGAPIDYSLLKVTLRTDFLVLRYLLKHAANIYQRCTYEERLLMFYFRVQFVCLVTRHWLRWREHSAVLKLTLILQHLANVVGERVNAARFGDLTASDFLDS